MKSKLIHFTVVAALFAVSMAGAQSGDPANTQKQDKAKEEAKKNQTASPLIEFQIAAAPWAQVLDWLKDITGLPIATQIRPKGSLTFIPPKGTDGTNKKYTVAEIIDVLNESLLEQKLVIVRRAASIMILSADEPLPLEVVKSVTFEQLHGDLGKTEIVRLNYPLRSLQAEDFAPGVKKMMGSFGRVIPIKEANQLILIDTVANLRIVVKMLDDIAQAPKKTPPSGLENAMEKALKQNPDIQFAEAKVREAEAELHRVQQQVLGRILVTEADLKAAREILTETRKRFETAVRLRSSGKGLVSDLDIREAAVAVAKYGGDVTRKEAELNALMGKLPLANRSANSPREPVPVLRTYVVASGNAGELGKVLLDVYKESPAVRITPTGNTQIMVYAPAAIQDDIAKHIEANNNNPAPVPKRQVPPLLQGKNVANLFKTMALPIKVDFRAAQVKETVDVLSDSIKDKSNGINLLLAPGKNNDQEKMPAITLPEPITLAATLQLIEDMSNIRFVVRDYGIVGMAAYDIPPGAILLSDILRGMPIAVGGGKKKG